ncbi:hypothetical protein [Fluviicola sp.]|uniref:hypothetical protein n=1 Tax=Fluviicola sp. TaxID=1917219 RepID=UPI00261C05A3|nr:hypothetical protein [Fluviicola sp.]
MATKQFLLPILLLLFNNLHAQSSSEKKFELSFYTCGMGSNMGAKFLVLDVQGDDFVYTNEQNPFWDGRPTKKTDTLCLGKIRQTTIDSIIDLIQPIQDTLIYNTNTEVRSGVIQYIRIQYENRHLQFTLHNASDPVAEKIVALLNSNIPEDKPRLWLFKTAN